MPPQTRRSKASKENIGVIIKTKSKAVGKVTKPRKALADKTNSASDDNVSTEIPKKGATISMAKDKKKVVIPFQEDKSRPRRERKLPNNISNNKESDSSNQKDVNTSSVKNDSTILSPFKTPEKKVDNSLIANRPKRICRLPSKFDDHSVSPNKFIPVGCHASTPIVENKKKPLTIENKDVLKNKSAKITNAESKKVNQNKLGIRKSPIKRPAREPTSTSDTNNNAKQRQLRQKKLDSKKEPRVPIDKVPSIEQKTDSKKLQHSFSFRVLEDKKNPSKRDNSHLDVYEFTYDPTEEPPPQKKKRKKAVKRNPPKPRTVVFKNNYDQNLSKALAALKNVVSKKPTESQVSKPNADQNKQALVPTSTSSTNKPVVPSTSTTAALTVPSIVLTTNEKPSNQLPKPHTSIRVEDIAADFEPLMDHNDINYSPVMSPKHGTSPLLNPTRGDSIQPRINHYDPLNLEDNLSFFDDIPVASSSMNTSVRRPHASPWRVQFEQLPIKWHVNTYIKPNMTPAVESSFITFNDSNKKKHVYTNLVPESNYALPEIVDKEPNLKQTSIISFIKEVAERSASKKKRAESVTPTKANSLFVGDVSNMSVVTNRDMYRTPSKTPRKEPADNCFTPCKIQENVNNKAQENKENFEDGGRNQRKIQTPKSTNKDGTFFGFDESEDLENISPVKINNPRVRALRPRARAVLQEINAQSGPTRAKVPAKSKIVASSDAVNRVYEELKSATDAPVFAEKNCEKVAATNIDELMSLQDEDSQSVHLFEDIELVHHLKPTRKSYGKAKKVTFQQTTAASDSDSQSIDVAPARDQASSDEDDLADLTFTLPNVARKDVVKKKAVKKKKQQSKKEKAEMEAWAAQFNSMCEDVEEFPLLVE